MARELTRKQREFAAKIIAGQNGTRAALETYDTTDYKTASVIATENLAKPRVRAEIQKALNDQDISIKDGLLVIKDALVAEGTNKAGSKVPLWVPRLIAAEKVLKLHHAYDGTTRDSGGQRHAHLHLEVGSEVSKDVLSWLAKWFREFKMRPTQEQFVQTFDREPTETERKLLADHNR